MTDHPTWNYPPVIPGVEYAPNRGHLDWTVRWPQRAAEDFLRVPVGVGRDGAPVVLDLRWHGPHVVCTGADRSAFLRTVLIGLADWFSPDLVQFLVTDFDGALDPMRLVPHATTTAFRLDSQPEKRLARAIGWEVWRRGTLTEPALAVEPALVLAFEDADRLLAERPELRDVLATVARDGGRLRMHLLLSASDPSALPGLPVSVADGQGTLGTQRFQLAAYTSEQLAEFSYTFMYYTHPARPLWWPSGWVTYDRMMACDQGGEGIPVGVLDDGSFTTLRIDFSRRSHLVVRADPGCGKTTALRTILRGLAATDAVVLDLAQLAPVVSRLRTVLLQRLAAPEAWDGPEVFIVADDYDTVPANDNPLGILEDLLRHGFSIGVHVIVATTGEVSGLPVIPALPDCAALLLSNPDLPAYRWDTVESRYGLQREDPLFARPRGRAFFDGPRPQVQVAIDTVPPRLEFRPVADLFILDNPVIRENLLAVVGTMDGGVPVKLNVCEHLWCGGDFGMGKTTLLRRVAYSLAARYTPDMVQLLAAESGADRLADLTVLPHTAAHVTDPYHLATLLDDELRRRLVLEQEASLDAAAQLVVLADGAGDLVAAAPALADTFRRVVAVGERVGMSLVLTERLPSGPLADLHEMLQVRVTLPYAGDGGEARTLGVPKITSRRFAGPGAAYVRGGDSRPRSFMLAGATPDLVREARFRKGGPALRALPLSPPAGLFTCDELFLLAPAGSVPIGLDNLRQPVTVDFDRERHLVVTGTPGSGRSTVLRTLLRGVAQRYTARECAVLLLHDNMITGVLPEEHVLDTSSGLEPRMLDEVLTALRKRVGNPEWTGPRLFVAIDDLDRFAPDHDPLTALRDMLPHATEIGLHFLVTGGPDILTRPEFTALAATRLTLSGGRLPESTAGEIPALPAVGHGLLGDQRVSLPWYQL